MQTSLTMTEAQHRELLRHLFPEDGCEAVAIALCGRAAASGIRKLLVQQLVLVPYEICSVRLPDRVTWPTEFLLPLLKFAAKYNLAVVKIHGHTGYDRFSEVDDHSDRQLYSSIYSWVENEDPHASVICMRDGRVFGRTVSEVGDFRYLDSVTIVGDNIQRFEHSYIPNKPSEDFGRRIAQTFGTGTYALLRKLRIGVVGCSGTGSPIVEQLARNCVGSLVLVDPDWVEEKNLNRIANTTMEDALSRNPKVEVARRAVERMSMGTKVEIFQSTSFHEPAIKALSVCDVVFGCVDTIDGRFLLNKLASFYMIPYFDLGVRIDADGKGGVDQVCGSVHYVKPGGQSLLSRNVFSLEQVRAAGLQRTDPEEYSKLLEEGYIRGVHEDRPAVVQLNTLIASLAINELLARLHPYRIDPNSEYAVTRVSLSHGLFGYEAEGTPCMVLSRHLGRGDVYPLLDSPELSKQALVDELAPKVS